MSVQTERSEPLGESDVFHILGNDRRRAIVQLLAEAGDRVDVSDVATEIADRESDSATVPNNLYKSVYVSLQQTHLPQLEEDAVIQYDSDAKTIESGENFEDVLQYVDGEGDDHRTLLAGHLAIGLLGLAVIALGGIDTGALNALDPVLVSVVLFLFIAASSTYQLLN
ncbi:ArsR family transcriptional regulator [Halobacteria archaeon AArc-dxtr1]|nr:ArsR family transcriptional regulator [Halobacteria archaeon AArc-dxtr1]